MNRRAFLIVSSLMLACCIGCNTKPSTTSEIEAKVKAGQRLASVSLVDDGEGKYSGTAVGPDGVKFNVTVTVGKNQISWEGVSDSGNKFSGNQSWSNNPGPR